VGAHDINYVLEGPAEGPTIVFVNGLTQYLQLWAGYTQALTARGYRVLSYDMLGQGRSSKPVISIDLPGHVQVLDALMAGLGIGSAHVAGISFGGIIALKLAIQHPERTRSLVAMSTFAELTPQLELMGQCLYEGLAQAGLPYLQGLLMPMNLSSAWIERHRAAIPEMKRTGYVINDLYALQNLMESFTTFQPFTRDLERIRCPTLILHGEHDFLTPRDCHETLRRHIPGSRLVIIQHGYHAFTLEHPGVVARQVDDFVRGVEDGAWVGDQSVWVASEDPADPVGAVPFPGDHMRMIHFPPAGEETPPAPARARRGGKRHG
jgi:pimeloyl-ACP methyl ester carboxylesterase